MLPRNMTQEQRQEFDTAMETLRGIEQRIDQDGISTEFLKTLREDADFPILVPSINRDPVSNEIVLMEVREVLSTIDDK